MSIINSITGRVNLKNRLSAGEVIHGIFTTSFFASDLASSIQSMRTDGTITDIDIQSGYCSWKDMNGNEMPVVMISNVVIKDKTKENVSSK